MLRFIMGLFKLPSRQEWSENWKGIVMVAAILFCVTILIWPEEYSLFSIIIHIPLYYCMIFLGVIAKRIVESETKN